MVTALFAREIRQIRSTSEKHHVVEVEDDTAFSELKIRFWAWTGCKIGYSSRIASWKDATNFVSSIERIGGKRSWAITLTSGVSFSGTSGGGGAVSGLVLITFNMLFGVFQTWAELVGSGCFYGSLLHIIKQYCEVKCEVIFSL